MVNDFEQTISDTARVGLRSFGMAVRKYKGKRHMWTIRGPHTTPTWNIYETKWNQMQKAEQAHKYRHLIGHSPHPGTGTPPHGPQMALFFPGGTTTNAADPEDARRTNNLAARSTSSFKHHRLPLAAQ